MIRASTRKSDGWLLLSDAIETSRPAAQQRGIALSAEAPAGYCIRADPGRLLQVIGNLLTNALKFTPAGGRVLLSAKPVAGETVFTVSDSGPGIAPEDMNHLFERFWQARDGDSRGIGLGLTIAKGIVESHGGRIWVDSTPGMGSTFSFSIPASTKRELVV
jgi:signal transduction histidine kinase